MSSLMESVFSTLSQVKGAASPCASCGQVVFCCSACSLNARKTWHGDECLDVSGRPLEPALSGLSPRCRMALRAMRRWRRAANTGSDPRHGSTERTGNGVGSVERGIRFNDLQEHYEQRSQRNIEMLETEAAISAVLACGTPGDVGVNGDPRNEDVCGKLAADMLPALCKVRSVPSQLMQPFAPGYEACLGPSSSVSSHVFAANVEEWIGLTQQSCHA